MTCPFVYGTQIYTDEHRLLFVNILSEADERLDRRYELKSLGYDLDKVEQRVLEIYQIEREDLYSKGRERIRAEARGLFCNILTRTSRN